MIELKEVNKHANELLEELLEDEEIQNQKDVSRGLGDGEEHYMDQYYELLNDNEV